MSDIHHALVLNLHQPHGNLENLLEEKPWETSEILYAYDRIPRLLWPYEDVARVHLSISGSLLETLSNPEFQKNVYGIVDTGTLIWHLQNRGIIDMLGGAYYHPLLPLIPEADREEQLDRWQGIARHLIWRERFDGFWPPEMGFSMELIPLLKSMGYQYVLVDSPHVIPVTPMSTEELLYRPHVACYDGHEIIVVVRDRTLSDMKVSGISYQNFREELTHAIKNPMDAPPLVTTCCDGENGPLFRNTDNDANFWGLLYRPLLDEARQGGKIKPILIHEYLEKYGTHGEVTVRTGSWNTDWDDGQDFLKWTGNDSQKKTLQRVHAVSSEIQTAIREARERELGHQEEKVLEEAHWRLLRAETSCNFYWGDVWVQRANHDLDAAEATLGRFRSKKYLIDADPGW